MPLFPDLHLLAAGTSLPDVLSSWGVPAVAIAAIVVIVAVPKIADGVKATARALWWPMRLLTPNLYTKAARERDAQRRRIATLLLRTMDLAESAVGWSFTQFSDFRVTVESIDNASRVTSLFGLRKRTAIYRTKNLLDALSHERTQIVHLRGRPGSGKTIALRQLARIMLEKLRDGSRRPLPLVLYVNLREFEMDDGTVTVDQLEAYLRGQLNPRNSPELNYYLTNQLHEDLNTGDVLLLFDSFDEIPAVVGSEKIDAIVTPYVETISSMLGGGAARCIVASREYKGPRVGGWVRMELAPLSYEEQVQMMRAFGLDRHQLALADPLLTDATLGFASDLRTPLGVSLLAKYLRERGKAPRSPSQLFENLVRSGLIVSCEGDEAVERLALSCLERLAVEAMKPDGSGLSITTEAIDEAAQADNGTRLQVIDAVLHSGLLVAATAKRRGRRTTYGFIHRRMLEYLATSWFVVGEASISGADLATQRQWRETAVTILQLSDDPRVAELVTAINGVLSEEVDRLRAANLDGQLIELSADAVHVLEMLAAAFATDTRRVPDEVRTIITELAAEVWPRGPISERRLVLDCVVLAETDVQLGYIDDAFSGRSAWLRISALRRCSDLTPLPSQIADAIRRLLVTMLASGAIRRDRAVLDSHLRRIYQGSAFIMMRRVVVFLPYALFLLIAARVVARWAVRGWTFAPGDLESDFYFGVLWPLLFFWVFQSSAPMSYQLRQHNNRIMDWASTWFLRNERELPSEGFWDLLWGLATLQIISYIVQVIISGDLRHHSLVTVLYIVAALYGTLWGACALQMLRYPEGKSIHIQLLLLPVIVPYMAPRAARDIWRWGTGYLIFVVRSLVWLAVWILGLGGLLYLLSKYGGTPGRDTGTGITWLFSLFIPAGVAGVIIAEMLNRHHVSRALKRVSALTERQLLDEMGQLGSGVNVADYLRRLRTEHEYALAGIGTRFLIGLMRNTEVVADLGNDIYALAHAIRHNNSPSVYSLELTNGESYQLEVVTLMRWGALTLDELGRLFEHIRER